jgi:hypothetical protein
MKMTAVTVSTRPQVVMLMMNLLTWIGTIVLVLHVALVMLITCFRGTVISLNVTFAVCGSHIGEYVIRVVTPSSLQMHTDI